MEQKSLKKFELNNDVLKDFDTLMEMHLDEVQELKVTEIDEKSKLLNIISLCINIKTLIIEGDQRMNTNSIMANICKPELLEDLILTNVKLPSGHTLKRFTRLKVISLNNIRFSNIGAFISNIPSPEMIEGFHFYHVDFEKNSITILERFKNLKYLNLDQVNDCKLEKLDFLTSNKTLQKLKIVHNHVVMQEVNSFLKGKMIKEIAVDIISSKNHEEQKNTLAITEEGICTMYVHASCLEEFTSQVNLYRVDKIFLILDKTSNVEQYIKPLKKSKASLNIIIKDCSYLTVSLAKVFEEKLKIEKINFLDIEETQIEYSCSLETYIKIRKEIDSYNNKVSKHSTITEKFLEIYKILGENIEIDKEKEGSAVDSYNLEYALIEKKCCSMLFANLLQNCLACLEIESNRIQGINKKDEKEHRWNQIKLEEKWYNADLAMDVRWISQKNIFKRKSKYCLLNDQTFYMTHTPKLGNTHFAEENFDKNILRVFFKTGIYHSNFIKSYITSTKSKSFKTFTKWNGG